MFAIAIYDSEVNKLQLFRDRMGIKPIYYYFDAEDFIFSSELKSINCIKKNKELNYDAIYAYLHLGYIPTEQTIYKKIFKLNPGAFLTYEKNEISKKFYWRSENKVFKEAINLLLTVIFNLNIFLFNPN